MCRFEARHLPHVVRCDVSSAVPEDEEEEEERREGGMILIWQRVKRIASRVLYGFVDFWGLMSR